MNTRDAILSAMAESRHARVTPFLIALTAALCLEPSLASAAAWAPSPMRRDSFRVTAARATVVLGWRSGDRFAPARHGLGGHLPKLCL
jgi:hypothetical protein